MLLHVPEDPARLSSGIDTSGVRLASITDVPSIAALERSLTGSYRPADWSHFIEVDHFTVFVDVAPDGTLLGAINVTNHIANCTLGPAHARDEASVCRLTSTMPVISHLHGCIGTSVERVMRAARCALQRLPS